MTILDNLLDAFGLSLLSQDATFIDCINFFVQVFFVMWLFGLVIKGLFRVLRSVGHGL